MTRAVPNILRWTGADGVALSAATYDDPAGPPVVLLHGGGQTRHAWGAAAERLAIAGSYAVVPDLRGHGESAWSPDGLYELRRFADDLRALAGELSAVPVLVGASLGGLTSLLACGEAPQLAASALILVDVAHRADPDGVARIVAFMSGHPDGFGTYDEAADAVAAYLPHRERPSDTHGLRNNLRRHADGRLHWHWDPRLLDWMAEPESAMPPARALLDTAVAVPCPLLLLRGMLSDVVDAEIAKEMLVTVPNVELVVVAGAGHMIAGDRNDRFVDAIVPTVTSARRRHASSKRIEAMWRAARVPPADHPGGNVEHHVRRTAERVASWGGREALVLAAMAHAVYGTDGFDTHALAPNDRRPLIEAIGTEAESIVYAHAACDRAHGYPWRVVDGVPAMRDRFSGVVGPLPSGLAADLVMLAAANEADVLLNAPATQVELCREIRDLLATWQAILPAPAARSVAAILRPSANEP